MGLYEQIKEAANAKGYSINRLEKELGFPRSSISKYNKNIPSMEKIQKIADFLNLSISDIMKEENDKKTSTLTQKDERDISKTVNALMEKLESNDGAPLFFEGTEMSAETKILFEQQLKSLVTTVKEINKVKFNPNKNKK